MRPAFNTIVFLAALTSAATVSAQKIEFPYDARVVGDGTFARAGAGENWFPTQRLAAGTIVTVHRHDAGGWFQISPPEGSFSWVPARYVQPTGPNEATITEDKVVAYVGSDFGEETTVYQRSLDKGTKVEIIDRRRIFTLSGEQDMFRIRPPMREFRWVPGASLVPVAESVRRQMDRNPYQTPSNAARTPGSPAGNGNNTVAGAVDVPELPANSQLARLKRIRQDQQRLAEVDKRFRDMITSDPSLWDLDSIESSYIELQQSVEYKPVAGQIDLRYPAIERYRRRLAEFNDFKRLTSQTEQRDAALVAQSMSRFGGNHVPPAANAASTPEAMFAGTTPPIAFASASNQISDNVPSDTMILGTSGQNLTEGDFQEFVEFIGTDSAAEFTAPSAATVPATATVPAEIDFDSNVPSSDPLQVNWSSSDASSAGREGFRESPMQLNDPTPVPFDMSADVDFPLTAGAGVLTDDAAEVSTSDIQLAAAFSESELTPFAGQTPQQQVPLSTPTQIPPATLKPSSRYVGAGIVQRSTSKVPGAPYVLMTPQGRLIAYLTPKTGISLESFVGQSVGLQGSRSYKADLNSDHIEVTGAEPVRIRK
ncbi:MAG: hypothetical protein KDA91_08290 [Planctomycetaceae bacterium]|nr:hypothetical protein [Planctomycetaceae bacterium]